MHAEVEDAIPETRWIWAQQPLEEVQSELARLGEILWCDDLTRELEISAATSARGPCNVNGFSPRLS